MKKHLYIALLVGLTTQLWSNKALAQQPFTFTQYMNNLTPVNNAYSTTDNAGSVNLIGRRQWVGIDGAPSSFLLNGSVPLAGVGGNVGLVLLQDKIGPENLTEINAFFAKKVQLSGGNFLSASINAGFRNHKITYSSLDPSDPKFQNSDVNETITNLGFGVMLYGSNYYVGLSLPRLSLNSGTNTSPNAYYLTGAYVKDLGTDFKIKPSVLLAYQGNALPLEYNFSATLYVKEDVGVGFNYRNDNAVAGILTVNVAKNIQFGYSYQFSVGKYPVGGVNNTTQELTLSYRFGKNLAARFL
ncbi:PorP/SprF family type IX secretion system membrane protein [Mucilaginibacter sp. HMF5004]|uniref:PorP/SprF family type IX secretion system membrane protein n=1 Tax=Mucilaginibacter rivuli TaxID=2857527 RepID=UPI001C5E23A0|nr:PorP/SprF family type IX secretion system membrane protein [Mucilaginibacter rivuli]MBW4891062.1 PorP/SprF family type IX secretion system membrane protein [Mucilaginibacter rivuli]